MARTVTRSGPFEARKERERERTRSLADLIFFFDGVSTSRVPPRGRSKRADGNTKYVPALDRARTRKTKDEGREKRSERRGRVDEMRSRILRSRGSSNPSERVTLHEQSSADSLSRSRRKRKRSCLHERRVEGDEEESSSIETDEEMPSTWISSKRTRGSKSLEEEESGLSDDHEDLCMACNSGKDIEILILCDKCPKVCHTFCLNPPLKKVPSGEWLCPECETSTFANKVERILKCRRVDATSSSSSGETQYLVKWKGLSHVHCSWVSSYQLDQEALSDPSLRLKMRNTKEDPDLDTKLQEYTTIDRILNKRARKGDVEFLVKWCALGYDEATWEDKEVVESFKHKVDEFESRTSIYFQGINKGNVSMGRFEKFVKQPDFLNGGKLHDYQLEGLNWLRFARKNHRNVILGDEMGLGKTVQSVTFLKSLVIDGISRPSLVVAPLVTLDNWLNEFNLWAPDLNVIVYWGNTDARAVLREQEFFCTPKELERFPSAKHKAGKFQWHSKEGKQMRVKFHVLLTSYEIVIKDASIFRGLGWDCLIVDEGHRLKNSDSRIFQTLHDIDTSHRVILTGTPLQNNLEELFMLMHFLEPELFDSVEEFDKEFSKVEQGEQIQKLHKVLAPHMLRRMKKDVLQQLPPKRELIVRVELSRAQKQYYKQILLNNYPVLQMSKSREGKSVPRLRNVIMELRKCCNHPYLFHGAEENLSKLLSVFPNPLERLVQASGKLKLLDQMMCKLHERGHRVLVYSQFTSTLDILEDWMHGRKWEYVRIDGSISGPERQRSIEKFNRPGSTYFCFLLSTKAGGLGINLTTADTVIIFDSDWNPHNDIQAQARAHRIGQMKEVMIYRMVTRASIEERMMQQAKRKLVLEHLVVRKMSNDQELRQEELDDILRFGAAELFEENENQAQTECAPEIETEKEVHRELRILANGPLAKGKETIREKEGRAGRDGGDGCKSVVTWDDASIERLLDRSAAWSEHDVGGAENDDEYLKAFKVAQFDIQPEEQGGADNYWDKLLQDRFNREQELKQAELGKGKRRRDTIKYVDGSVDDSADKPYTVNEDDETDDETDEETSLQSMPDDTARPAKHSKREFTSTITVHGLSFKERYTFFKHLMSHGVEGFGGKPGWISLLGSLPNVELSKLEKYGNAFLNQLHEVYGSTQDTSSLAQGQECALPCEMISMKSAANIIHRFTVVWMVKRKLSEVSKAKHTSYFPRNGAYKLPATPSIWDENKDIQFLQSLLHHGFDFNDRILEHHPDLHAAMKVIMKEEGKEENSNNMMRWLRNRYNVLKDALFSQYILPFIAEDGTNCSTKLTVPLAITKESMMEQLYASRKIPIGGFSTVTDDGMKSFAKLNNVPCIEERLSLISDYNAACRSARQSLLEFYKVPRKLPTLCSEASKSLQQVRKACGAMLQSLHEIREKQEQCLDVARSPEVEGRIPPGNQPTTMSNGACKPVMPDNQVIAQEMKHVRSVSTKDGVLVSAQTMLGS